ncbi:hypothetical protein F0P96_00100 [Hymenobacter busanensis]|uniref:Uncharacterized protein n=1 Tax=Hymenobacter busanensis TaxID=2607656 RepID=A0A7L4ZVC0_9BACT|nr:hypothetical protein [Hymenobacter busanensis]KAA9339076.1 hypothetical protein F0P96_00100 [Hymenobacter busanensis]QHJ07161.1 hypothetical protein GUY19_07645 [Hymenobacter busanensis]
MKKMLLLLTVATLSLTAAHAQDQNANAMNRRGGHGQMGHMDRTPEQRADMQTQRLTKQLALSAEQQNQVRTIALAQANEMEAMRGQRPTDDAGRQAMGQKMREAQARYDEQLKAVFTAEQYTKYAQLREDRMEHREEKKADIKSEKQKPKATKSKTKVKAS